MSNKTSLNEYCHKNRYVTPCYYSEKDCNNMYTKCTVTIGDTTKKSYGNFVRKKEMENRAAGDMLEFLQSLPNKIESDINLSLLEEKSFIEKESKSSIYLIDYNNTLAIIKSKLSEEGYFKGPVHIFSYQNCSEKPNIVNSHLDVQFHTTDIYNPIIAVSSVEFLMTFWCGQNLDYLSTFKNVVLVSNKFNILYYLLSLLLEKGINCAVLKL